MKTCIRTALVLFIVAAVLPQAVTKVQAGTIHPALQAEMDAKAADKPISAIVYLHVQVSIAALDKDLRDAKATRKARHQTVVEALQAKAQSSQGKLKAHFEDRMTRGGVDGYTSHWISNLMIVYATKAELEELAKHEDVDTIERNFTISLIEPVGFDAPALKEAAKSSTTRGIGVTPGLVACRAPEAWALGYTGAGRIVANLDTGVDGTHPALADRWRGNNEPWSHSWLDLLGSDTEFPWDGHGHGTHVMGTECGRGDATGDTVGIAYDAEWISSNAINQGVGDHWDNDVITAYEWFADPDGDPMTVDDVPDVVQNSWAIDETFGAPYEDCDSRWWEVIDHCEAAGCATTWSASNDGPDPMTIASPADRATTGTNCLSVGAVDATDFAWPYPIANFSSRGPTGCDVGPGLKIKPEVVAPGVEVYSSIYGTYMGLQGTSMAGPHVAGIIALMRQANPNLDVHTIKTILMETARDLGDPGEDNTYGWGHVDAEAACLAAIEGFGILEGYVTNSSWNNNPIEGARIRILDLGCTWYTNPEGFFKGAVPAGSYDVEISHPSFATETVTMEFFEDNLTVQDFSLVDVAGPTIVDVSDDKTNPDPAGPYRVKARITDHSTVDSAKLYFRINESGWTELDMTADLQDSDVYYCDIPGTAVGSQIDFYVMPEDGLGMTNFYPENAPLGFNTLLITETLYLYDGDTFDPDWQLGVPGDQATSGLWVFDDPIGTEWIGIPVQCEDDNTEDPGVKCFVTGNAPVGSIPGANQVSDGCTTLLSPVFDLSEVTEAFVSYHRWFGQPGLFGYNDFAIDISNDGGGHWLPLELVRGDSAVWQRRAFRINDIYGTPNQVQLRFVACDELNILVEAAIDDFSIETFTPAVIVSGVSDDVPVQPRTRLEQNAPNPFNPATTIKMQLSSPTHTRLELFDMSGRLVRTLVNDQMEAGTHYVRWNGMDNQDKAVASGVYFYRLKAGVFEQSRRMTLLR